MGTDYLEQLNQFLSSNLRNTYLYFDNISVYVRKSKRKSPLGEKSIDFLDIANIKVEQNMQRKGICRQFITAFESLELPIFVENVLNSNLEAYLLKRGYTRHPNYPNDICLYLMQRRHHV